MKISTAEDQVFIRKNIRIIGYRIYFFNKHTEYIINTVFGSAMHLWYTAKGIRILHLFFFHCRNLAAA